MVVQNLKSRHLRIDRAIEVTRFTSKFDINLSRQKILYTECGIIFDQKYFWTIWDFSKKMFHKFFKIKNRFI